MATRAYERIAVLPLEEVLRAIETGEGFKYKGHFCHTSSNRLLTYYCWGVACCVPGCKISGEYFAVERSVNQRTSKYHLNLYGRDGDREVMMTSDHKLPRSKGGPDGIMNRQPMCYPHNAKKGNQLIHL